MKQMWEKIPWIKGHYEYWGSLHGIGCPHTHGLEETCYCGDGYGATRYPSLCEECWKRPYVSKVKRILNKLMIKK